MTKAEFLTLSHSGWARPISQCVPFAPSQLDGNFSLTSTLVVAWLLYLVAPTLIRGAGPMTTRVVCMSDRGEPKHTRDRREEDRKTGTEVAASSDKKLVETASSASDRIADYLAAILRGLRK